MPALPRTWSREFSSSQSSTPSTTILPCWCSSSPFMHRINVDFPDPEGPQITTFSLSFIRMSMSFRTCRCPNHLLKLFMVMAYFFSSCMCRVPGEMERPGIIGALWGCFGIRFVFDCFQDDWDCNQKCTY